MPDAPRPPIRIAARWILPVAAPPVRDGLLTIGDSHVLKLQPRHGQRADYDLGDSVLLPGLVNAHTHLEFSDLASPIGEPGVAITDWIPEVVARRRASTKAESRRAVTEGLSACRRFGTSGVGEIATLPWPDVAFDGGSPEGVIFFEGLGNAPQDASGICAQIARRVQSLPSLAGYTAGVSPHAPYSVHPRLLEGLLQLARKNSLPVAMHLAESRQELEWLATGGGPFLTLLESLGAESAHDHLAGRRPLDFLRQLQTVPHSLVVHGNYLVTDEMDFIADRSERMHVVCCPRTHQFFRHEPYPLVEMLKRGINVAVGTDSRASSPDLSLWEELRAMGRAHPDVAPETILRLGTQGGARALKMPKLGSLLPGSRAVLLVQRRASLAADPYESLFEEEIPVVWSPDGEPNA